MSSESKPPVKQEAIPDFYIGSKSKKIICHPMINKEKEVGKPFRVKAYQQEFTWKKRIYPMPTDKTRIVTDHKGIGHLYFDANDSTILGFEIDHEKNCKKCGGKMSIDAKNARDMVKRKTITAIWGVDQTHIMLLLIMGIILMILVLALVVIYSDSQKNAEENKSLTVQLAEARAKAGSK